MMATFSFNLLPKKTKEAIQKEERRDSYIVYYSLLVLLGVLMWLGLLFFNNLVVDAKRTEWVNSNQNKIARIDSEFREIRNLHGELVVKTNSLEPLLSKDVDPEIVFLVAEEVFPSVESNIRVVGYDRNEDGSFSITVAANNELEVSKKARSLVVLSSVKNVTIDSLNYNQNANQLIARINFEVDITQF